MCFDHVSSRLTHPSEDCQRAQRALLAGLLFLGTAIGCGSDPSMPATPAAGSGGSSSTSAGTGASAGSGGSGSAGDKQAPDKLAGAFTLRLVPQSEPSDGSQPVPAQTAFLGAVSDGPTPVQNTWKADQSAVGCTLYTPKSPFCDPNCGSSAVCVEDDQCVDRPTSKSVGTIHLKGVGSSEVAMNPVGTNNNYQPTASTKLPYPPCAEGAEVTLSVDGGAYRAFDLKSKCIAPLEFDGPIKLTKDMPLALKWKAPGDPKLARMQIRLDISHHGGSRGKIECDVEDSGSLELPAAMITKLLDLGVAGYPTIILTRASNGGASSGEPKQVTFSVVESVERAVTIDGLISCTDDTDCPSGKTCQTDLTCK